jgi:hypothetical protein
MDIDSGMFLHEFFDVRWRVMQADAVNRRHADGARNSILDLLQLAVQQFLGLEDLFAVIIKCLALAGETKHLSAPLDELQFEDASQRTDLLVYC